MKLRKIMDELKRNRPIGRFKSTIESFCLNASGSNLAEIQKWLSKPTEIERLHTNLKKEQVITTLLSPETPKKLHTFFYPLDVISSTAQEIKDLTELVKINGKLLLELRETLVQIRLLILIFTHIYMLNMT